MKKLLLAMTSAGLLLSGFLGSGPAVAVGRSAVPADLVVGAQLLATYCYARDTDSPDSVSDLIATWNGQDPTVVATKTGTGVFELDPGACPDPAFPYAVKMFWTANKAGTYSLKYCHKFTFTVNYVRCDPFATVTVTDPPAAPIATAPSTPAPTPTASNAKPKSVKCISKKTFKKRVFKGVTKCPKGWVKI